MNLNKNTVHYFWNDLRPYDERPRPNMKPGKWFPDMRKGDHDVWVEIDVGPEFILSDKLTQV